MPQFNKISVFFLSIFLAINAIGGIFHFTLPDSGLNSIAKMGLDMDTDEFKTAVSTYALEGSQRIATSILILYILYKYSCNIRDMMFIMKLYLIHIVVSSAVIAFYKPFPHLENAPGRFKLPVIVGVLSLGLFFAMKSDNNKIVTS